MTGYLEAAERMFSLRRYDLAAEYFRKHLSVRPRHAWAIARLAQALWLGGHRREAHVRLAEALELDAEDCNVHEAAAVIHRWECDWRKALVHCDKAIALHPNCDRHHLGRSYALEMGRRIEEAFEEALRAMALDPRDAGNHQQLVYLHMEYGKVEDAWKLCQDYLQLAPDRADAHARRGWCLHRLGRGQEGVQAYLDALAIDPNLSWVRENLALLRRELGYIDPEPQEVGGGPPEKELSFQVILDALRSVDPKVLGRAFFVLLRTSAAVALLAWAASALLLGAQGGWPFVACLHASLALAMAPWNLQYFSILHKRLYGGATRGLLVESQLHAMVVLALVLAMIAIAKSSWLLAYCALLPLAVLPIEIGLLYKQDSDRR
jgi:tetratricopeptide (TPR) repeat protein